MADTQQKINQKAHQVAQKAKSGEYMENWARLGYAARGVLYGLIGYLAIQLITTGHGKITGQTGALATVASSPFGKLLLGIIVLGLAGYAVYSFIRAIFDPFNKGEDTEGIVTRIGYFVTGLIYTSFVIPGFQMLQGSANASSGNSSLQQFASGVMQHPWGPWLVGFIGIVIIGVGIYEIYDGWSEQFKRHFELV